MIDHTVLPWLAMVEPYPKTWFIRGIFVRAGRCAESWVGVGVRARVGAGVRVRVTVRVRVKFGLGCTLGLRFGASVGVLRRSDAVFRRTRIIEAMQRYRTSNTFL